MSCDKLMHISEFSSLLFASGTRIPKKIQTLDLLQSSVRTYVAALHTMLNCHKYFNMSTIN